MKSLTMGGTLLVVCLVGAVSATATTTTPGAVRATTACAKGSVAARIGGKTVCLRVGSACKAAHNRVYKKHGFTCVAGRLRRTPKPSTPTPTPTPAEPSPAPATSDVLQLLSDAWTAGGAIPAKYTCDGANVSPPLSWKGTPAGTRYVAVMVDDPDAPVSGGFVHWITYNIPWQPSALAEGQSGPDQGMNDANRKGFTGPCPPAADGPHHYVVHLYALSGKLTFDSPPIRAQLLAKIAPIKLGETTLVGTYDR
jgi:Raf kinase inhibitor-like YbhB/YbcL family protein